MAQYTYAQLEGLWIDAGGSKKLAPLMAAIAMAESSGNSDVVNSIGACGLWQIHPYQPNCKTPQANAKMAVAKYRSQGLQAWEAYTNGSYKKFLRGNPPPPSGGGGKGGGGNNSGTGGGLPFVGPLANWLANPVDALERLGLIVLGGILVLVGMSLLAAGPTRALAREAGALSPKKQSNGPVLSPEDKEEKERRFQLAQRNAAIGERTVAIKESRENRIGRVSRIHGGRTSGREPNPEPVHGG